MLLDCSVQRIRRQEFLKDDNNKMEKVADESDEIYKTNNDTAMYQVVHDAAREVAEKHVWTTISIKSLIRLKRMRRKQSWPDADLGKFNQNMVTVHTMIKKMQEVEHREGAAKTSAQIHMQGGYKFLEGAAAA